MFCRLRGRGNTTSFGGKVAFAASTQLRAVRWCALNYRNHLHRPPQVTSAINARSPEFFQCFWPLRQETSLFNCKTFDTHLTWLSQHFPSYPLGNEVNWMQDPVDEKIMNFLSCGTVAGAMRHRFCFDFLTFFKNCQSSC